MIVCVEEVGSYQRQLKKIPAPDCALGSFADTTFINAKSLLE